MDTNNSERINVEDHLGIRPFCHCCGGGEIRDRRGKYKHTKAMSRRKNRKHRRAKPKHKDHRGL